ncbi:MAG: D-alanyl-D-alanine carboxypeptidase, partial [Pseudomonadota bacterium]
TNKNRGSHLAYRSTTRRGTNWCILALAVLPFAFASADSPALAQVLGKRASFVVDANTGRILHADRAEQRRYPASLTKMMTLYLVFERLEDGRLTYKTKITASPRASSQPPSKIGLKVGDQITVSQAIRALVTKSANDVATAVAEHIAGSEYAFARLMTNKAKLLGMKNTVFRNASGLPDRKQFTTARDMAKLAIRLQDHFPKQFRHFKTRTFRYKKRVYRNHNVLLGRYRGVNGIKTGYTRASGFNLVTSLQDDRRYVVAVVMGGRTGRSRNAIMRRLLGKHVKTASRRRTRRPDVRIALRARPRPAIRRRLASAPRRPTPLRQTITASIPAKKPAVKSRRQVPRYRVDVAKVRSIDVRTRAGSLRQAPRAVRQERPETQGLPAAVRNFMIGQVAEPSLLRAPRQVSRQVTRRPIKFGSGATAPVPAGRRVAVLRPSKFSTQPFEIQVGAYVTAEDASRQLDNVRQLAPDILAGAHPLTVPVNRGAQRMFRARFAGFDSDTAKETCSAMQKRAIQCFVARAQ